MLLILLLRVRKQLLHFLRDAHIAIEVDAFLDIDWEEALARRSGDVVAFQVSNQLRVFGDWLRQSGDSLLQTSSEYLREEARVTPTEVEFEVFQAAVTDLKNDVARTEARIQQLLQKIQPQ